MTSRKIATIYHQTRTDVHVVVRYNNEFAEFICKLYLPNGHYEPADYFTGDKQDALNTAVSLLAGI
jgi:hypothetical protein